MGAGPSVLSRRAAGSMRGMGMSVASSVRTHAPLVRKPKYNHADDPWFACEAGDIDMIANKIDKGELHVEDVDMMGNTYLCVACREGYLELADYLISEAMSLGMAHMPPFVPMTVIVKRSDLNHANNAGDTPLLLSLTHPHQRKCERNGGMWPTDNDHYLVPQVGEAQQLTIAGHLIAAGADVNKCNKRGMSAVHVASLRGWPAAVDYLIRNGANVNKADYKGATPLHTAAKIGAAGVVRLLLTGGADPSLRDRNGNTAMMAAVSRGQRAVANTLASFRAPVGTPNNFLHTPYHMACARGDVELAQLLRVSGARRLAAAETAFPGDKAEVLRVSVAAMKWGRGVENEVVKARRPGLKRQVRCIRQLPLFSCLSIPECRVLLSDVFIPKYFEPGDILFQEGEPCRHFYLLLEGKVKVQCSDPRLRSSADVHDAFRNEDVWREDDPHWMLAARRRMPELRRHVTRDGREDIADSDEEAEYADDMGEDPHKAAERKRNKKKREKENRRRRSSLQAAVLAEIERKKAKMAAQRAWQEEQELPVGVDDGASHYYILTPESKRPYFNEHCLVSNLVCQYSVRAVGKYTVKVLRMHPTYFKEFLMTSEQTARFMITKPEISKQRRRIRHAVTRRDRVPFPPAWTIATDDVERPNTPELVRERGEVAPVEKRDVRRAARPSVVHAEALERKRLELQAQLDGLDAPLPHGRQARPVDIALGFPPEYPPRIIRQGYKVTAPEIPLPPDVRAEVTLSNVPRKHPADAELLAKVLKNVQRFETQAAKDSAVMAGLEDDIAAAEAGDDDDDWSSEDSDDTAFTPISLSSDESSQEEEAQDKPKAKRVWFKRSPKKKKKPPLKKNGEFRGAWGSSLKQRPSRADSSDEEGEA